MPSFNTQPPEGGWHIFRPTAILSASFNTQPPEGGWRLCRRPIFGQWMFQHSAARRRLVRSCLFWQRICRFNTQPPEGGWRFTGIMHNTEAVSTLSRPKAAG